MARKSRIILLVFGFLLVLALVAPPGLGQIEEGPVVRFLQTVLGAAILSMPLVILVYVAHKAIGGRWKFSLRTLLIVTTLLAVALGLGVWLTR